MRVNILREINVLSCKHHDLKNLRVKKPPLKVHNTNLMPSIKDCCSVAKLCRLLVTPWTAARQASLSITNSWNLLKLISIEPVMPSSHLILCHPLLLLPSSFPSIRVFSTESALRIRWPNYWRFSFSISLSNAYSGLIFFQTDWFDLFAVQGILQHNSKASFLQCWAFFKVQLTSLCDYCKKSQLWLYTPLLAKWYLCFIICCPSRMETVFA